MAVWTKLAYSKVYLRPISMNLGFFKHRLSRGVGVGEGNGGNCSTVVRASISKPTPFIYLAFEKPDPFISLVVRNVDIHTLPFDFYTHLLLVVRQM